MKNFALLNVVVIFGFGFLWGCATLRTWPGNERSAEDKMIAIQEQIGERLKSGALASNQSQGYLKELKVVQTDYTELKDKIVYRDFLRGK